MMCSLWKDKYDTLRYKCLIMEKHNKRLINRIYHIKKMMNIAKKDRKAIMERLDRHNDDFRTFDSFFDADVLKEASFARPAKLALISNKKMKTTKSNSSNHVEKPGNEKQLIGAPKKPVNAYFIYCQRSRNEILNGQPNISHQDLTKLLAKQWNQMKPEQKQVYYEFYEQDKERYETELEEYTEAGLKVGKSKQKLPGKEETHANVVRSNIAASPTLNSLADPAGLSSGFSLAQIPSPTLAHDESPYGISNIPSPSFQ